MPLPILVLVCLTIVAIGLVMMLWLKIRAQNRTGRMRVINREDGDVYFLESTAVPGRPDFWDIHDAEDSELGFVPPAAGSYQGVSGATVNDYDPLGR